MYGFSLWITSGSSENQNNTRQMTTHTTTICMLMITIAL